jgi:drug/metabolite transporter (DMT)-like permease
MFREAVGARIWLAAAIMLAASVLLSYDPQAALGFSPRALAIVGACLCWAIDNNQTRKVSASDPVLLAMVKGLAAGAVNLGLAAAVVGMPMPSAMTLGAALVVGFFGYGVSLVLFIYALRHLGSARAGAHFSTAPFIGAGLAIVFLGEPVTLPFAAALAMMAGATWLVLTEQHIHEHVHEPLVHAHRHVHDAHHQHAHAGDEGPEPHAHEHVHSPLVHSHPHVPDLHHRHEH